MIAEEAWSIYLAGLGFSLFMGGIARWGEDSEDRRLGARLMILAPVWPVWVLVLVWVALRGVARFVVKVWKEAWS